MLLCPVRLLPKLQQSKHSIPLATIVNAVPSNITEACSSNNSILAVVVVAIIIGLSLNHLGEKGDALKKVLESGNEVIQLYLTFLINKVGPVAIFV